MEPLDRDEVGNGEHGQWVYCTTTAPVPHTTSYSNNPMESVMHKQPICLMHSAQRSPFDSLTPTRIPSDATASLQAAPYTQCLHLWSRRPGAGGRFHTHSVPACEFDLEYARAAVRL